MTDQCTNYNSWDWILSWGEALFPLILILIVIFFLSRRNWKRGIEMYQKSWDKQDEAIQILKEIRDSLKK